MEYPKISIICPVYQGERYLEQSIRSVLEQNYPNLEYIIIDGGSQDRTVEIIQDYASQLAYWVSEPDHGQSHAINKGLVKASGEIVNWLNADDYYAPNCLHTVARYFQEKPIWMYGGISRLIDAEGNFIRYSPGTDIYPNNLAKTLGWARIDQPETFFHKKALAKMGALREDLHYIMDRDWWIKYLLHFGLESSYRSQDVLVNFRIHPGSKTGSELGQFNRERNLYFQGIAQELGISLHKDWENEAILPTDEFAKWPDHPELGMETIHYFLWQLAEEAYARGDWDICHFWLKKIDKNLLAKEDQEKVRRLQFRNQYLPQGMVQTFRKWKAWWRPKSQSK